MAKETNKGDVEIICARVTKPASKKVANADNFENIQNFRMTNVLKLLFKLQILSSYKL